MLRRCTRVVHSSSLRRSLTTSTTADSQAWLFIDSVFPIQLARWDIRKYIGVLMEEPLSMSIHTRLSSVKTNGFEVMAIKPQRKDGGVFVQFKYDQDADPKSKLLEIHHDLCEQIQQKGLPTWHSPANKNCHVWLVKGTPWLEDMNRFPSNILKVSFDGPDVRDQELYELYRPFGRIMDITAPTPVPAGSLRYSLITYSNLHSAPIARNVTHCLVHGEGEKITRLRTGYEDLLHTHFIRDWLFSHPRVVLPVVLFLLGTVTYAIFDPIRSLMVKAKMLDWFSYKDFKVYQWLRTTTMERLSLAPEEASHTAGVDEPVWREREEAQSSLERYLGETPSTITFLHGPQGSGKQTMLQNVLQDDKRTTLVIDCKELKKMPSHSRLVASLAHQTGYWPIFTFFDSISQWIDLASVGLIGQKAGISSSLEDQLQEVLSVVERALVGVSSEHRAAIQRHVQEEDRFKKAEEAENRRRELIRKGIWHDGRIDCVAGNGVMSELGFGDESLGEKEEVTPLQDTSNQPLNEEPPKDYEREMAKRQRQIEYQQAVEALPIVLIRNFDLKGDDVLATVLAQWAASLAENQIAHVIVSSDNRENSKRLAKALPSKPLNFVTLDDADTGSALSFVKKRLHEAAIDVDFTPQRTTIVSRLGGRASDLETLIHKVRNGFTVEDAVEDIINRGVGELRKNAFGDDAEDAKNLPWSRAQAWTIMKKLSHEREISYYDLVLDLPFKSDERALRSMEQSELISITTSNGRPSTIRPGKPVYHYIFKRLAEDDVFRATLDIDLNNQIVSSAESTIRSCEEELTTLRGIEDHDGWGWFGGGNSTSSRVRYLLKKIEGAERKVEVAERKNADLRKILAKKGNN